MKSVTLLSLLALSFIALAPFIPVLALLEDVEVFGAAPSHHQSSSAQPASRSSSSHPSSHSFSSSSVASPVSSSAAVQPSTPAYPLNLTVPFSAAPSTWSIRFLDDTYYMVYNNSQSEVSLGVEQWSAEAVEASLEAMVGDKKQWKRQQKQLKRHLKRVNWRYSADAEGNCGGAGPNASCAPGSHGSGESHHHADKHDKHHNKGNSLMSFYLRHAQCRACVQSNAALLQATQNIPPTSLPPLASYQPAAVLKWCTLATPKLSSEQSPSVSGAPLADWEGVCIPAEAECPSATIDMNILSPTTCAADEPATKQSCTLCVLDGYQWQTGQRAFDNADNYAGQCVDPSSSVTPVYSSGGRYHQRLSVTELDSCPSVVASMETARRFNAMAASFGMFVAVMGLVLCCACLRACCISRKNRQVALLRLANSQASAEQSSVSVSVPAVSSSPAPSAPPAAGYPAAVAAQEYDEPLLSSGLNPPRMTVTAAYPQLQAQRVAVAQPYAYARF